MLVNWITRRLHHENVHAAHIFQQLEVDFAVGKTLNLDLAHRNSDVAANLRGQRRIGRAAEELEALVLAQVAAPLALHGRLGLFRPGGVCRGRLRGLFRRGLPAVLLACFRRCCQCFHFHLRLPPSWLALAASLNASL